MKSVHSLSFITATILLALSLQGCGSNNDDPGIPAVTAPLSTPPGVNSTIIPVDPQKRADFLQKSGLKVQNLENKAVLVDTKTLALSLTGSSSCPSVPETITILDDKLNILLKNVPNECTADLNTSFWEIILPPALTPRTADLNIDVISSRGTKLSLVASAPK
jgi:hypothetical protein